ncbi:MAG TPA: hypothetical protein VNZ86_09965, partial [Bacteroidia bacterium]|nr:hypothetical protein [Bacteroidia bacterium]
HWTNNGTFTHNSGKVTFSGALAANLAGTSVTTFYNMEVNKTSNAILTQTAATATVNTPGTLIMTAGIFTTGTNQYTGTGGFVATGGDFQEAYITGGPILPQLTGTGLYSITGGTVTLNGGGAQTLRNYAGGASTYNNLYFSNSGAKTITGTTVINGDVTVTGTATITANSAFVQDPTNTFTYNSTGTSQLTASTAVSVGAFVENAGGTLDINQSNFTVAGNWTKSAGTFTNTGTSRVLFTSTLGTQTYTDNGTVLNQVTVNNGGGVTLSNDMTIALNLTFTTGLITTAANNVILNATGTTVTGASQANGYVNGNLRKNMAAGASAARTFETGTSATYAPAILTFSACGGGYITVATNNGDQSAIYITTMDPNKTVNLNWQISNTSAGALTYTADFVYQAANEDASYSYSAASVLRYDGLVWNATTLGTANALDVSITGVATPAVGNTDYYEIGDDYNAPNVYNRVSNGTYSWSLASTWIQNRTGTVTASGTTALVGTGTSFTTDLIAGDIIMLQSTPGTTYTVASITDNTHLTLSAVATFSGAYGREHVPNINDFVNIGNSNVNTGTTIINMDLAAAGSINRMQFNAMSNNYTLAHTTASVLTVVTSVIMQQGTGAKTNLWNISTGNATVTGSLVIGNAVNTASDIASVTISTGTLTISDNLIFEAGSVANAANASLIITGAGTVNLGGVFQLDNGTAPYYGTFTPGATSIFNYNSATINQTLNLKSTAPAVTYANLYLNNTFTTGVTQGAAITAANVTGNLSVQTGIFNNGGFAIAGVAAKIFTVANGSTFNMTGAAVFPTGFGTFTFGATSNTYYKQGASVAVYAVASPGYGNLYLTPSGAFTLSFGASSYFVQGMMTIGDGTNTTTVHASAATATVNVTGDIVISTNATLDCSAFALNIFAGGNWTNNGGTFTPGAYTVTFNGTGVQNIQGTVAAQTFNNMVVAKTAGTLLSASGSTTTLTVGGTFTNTTGNFTAPATFTITGNATLSAGTVTATDLTFTGASWINNGGTFTHTGTLYLNNVGANQQFNGTAASQTFNNITLNNTAKTLSAGGSTVTLIINNLTSSGSGSLTSPATFTIKGNVLWTGTGTWIMGATTNLAGDITFSGGTLTPGTNFTFNGTTAQTLGGTSTYPAFTNLTM